MLADLIHALVGCDQLPLGGHIDAEVAGVLNRRRADAHVHLCGARLAQHLHHLGRRGAAHDGVVHHHQPLAGDHLLHGVELQVDTLVAQALVGLDESAAHIAVLDQPLAVGDAGLMGVADGGRDGGVRHADHHIGLDRGLTGQLPAHPHTCRVEELTPEHAVRPREVDVLEHAKSGTLRLHRLKGADAAAVDDDGLTGGDLALELRAQVVQSAGLGGDHPAGAV